MAERAKILIVDDEPGIVESLSLTFDKDYDVDALTDPRAARELIERKEFSVIIADQRMPRMTGVELLRAARELQPDAVRIVLSAYTDLEDLIAAINAGEVWRYLVKPWEPHELKLTVSQAVERNRLLKQNQSLLRELEDKNLRLQTDYELLRQDVERTYQFHEIVGKSPVMQQMFNLLRKVADSPVTILIQGETGTGKELVAKAIHYNSSRRNKKFAVQNCGALTDNLLESELFGHKKGSFTGAIADKKGLFEDADGGTVFLDEIGETSPAMQVRLLRVLQEGELKRVGDTETRTVDVRIIAAANQDLEQLVGDGKFREDLFYRLSVLPIRLPPLRERPEDLPLLAHHFLERANRKFKRNVFRISEEAIRLLEAYDFPGNVRELENQIERAVMMAEGEVIGPDLFADKIQRTGELEMTARGQAGGLMEAVNTLKRRMIREVLEKEQGNKTQAAEVLGLTRQSLQQMMKRLNME